METETQRLQNAVGSFAAQDWEILRLRRMQDVEERQKSNTPHADVLRLRIDIFTNFPRTMLLSQKLAASFFFAST